jgi:hypothetical protein
VHAELLDQLFPRVTKDTPGSHRRFVDWLPAVPAPSPVKAA